MVVVVGGSGCVGGGGGCGIVVAGHSTDWRPALDGWPVCWGGKREQEWQVCSNVVAVAARFSSVQFSLVQFSSVQFRFDVPRFSEH